MFRFLEGEKSAARRAPPPPLLLLATVGRGICPCALPVSGPHLPPLPLSRIPQSAPEDEDLILAKALQEQEHALSVLAGQGGLTGAWGAAAGGAPGAEEEGEEEEEEDLSPKDGEDDAAYAARLQAAEDRANYRALAGLGMAGLPSGAVVAAEGEDGGEGAAAAAPGEAGPATALSQDLLAGTDPAALSYEQLNALGEIAGVGPRGAAPGAVAALPVEVYGEEGAGGGCAATAATADPAGAVCVICQCDYEAGDRLARLPCGHRYHADCAAEALAVRKACPLCGREVE